MAGSSSNSSSGYSHNTSSSTPTVIQTPQSQWALQLSQMLAALGQYQYNWAQNNFKLGMGVTADQIDNYMKLAGYGAGLAQNLLGRYENTFEPLMDQYIQQAGTYNSAERQKFMMGQAESTAGQADQAAIDSAQRQLQAYGINPNSGRYQDLLLTARLQDAAARAGAGTQASLNTAAIGRQMTQTAAQMGQNIPGMTVNALQSAYTGVSGAENALLGMLNTGTNMTNSAANFGNAAANANKLPPVGQNSQSQGNSRQQSSGSSQQQDPNSRQQQQRGNQGQYNQNQGTRGNTGTGTQQQNGAVPGMIHGPFQQFQPGSGIIQVPEQPGQQGQYAPDYQGPVEEGGTGQVFDPSKGAFGPGNGMPGMGNYGEGYQGPVEEGGTGQVFDPSKGAFGPNNGDYQAGSGANYGYTPTGQDPGNYAAQQGQDFGNQQADYQNWAQGQYGGSYMGSSGGGGGYYAKGGAVGQGVIPNQTSGGFVPTSASPSGGAQTDDIPARLNAKEFVIPRDVTEHKGTEFFHNLIAKSRKARLGVSGPPAQPKMKPALRMKPTFTSHYVGGP